VFFNFTVSSANPNIMIKLVNAKYVIVLGGGGSIPQLFETSLSAVEAAESAPPPPPTPAASPTGSTFSTGPISAGLSAALNPGSGQQGPDRLMIARENLDTVAALVATSLYQIQYAMGGEALVSYICFHALRPTTPNNERRLVHKALGVLKSAQYVVHILHNAANGEGIELGMNTVVSLLGMGLSLYASWWWGWRAQPPAETASTKSSGKKK
jgi:hypothetical protein